MILKDYYVGLHCNISSEFKNKVLQPDVLAGFCKAHNYINDYEAIVASIKNRPEKSMFESAISEYQGSLVALSCGLYRYAFSGLRLFFEMSLAAIYYSAHEIYLRQWMNDSKDLCWGEIRDPEKGIFSNEFVSAFDQGFCDHRKHFLSLSNSLYRECSEYVHGNASTHQKLLNNLKFNEHAFADWLGKSDTIRMVILFAFSLRHLKYLSKEERESIRETLQDALWHLDAVRDHFEG